MHEIDWEIGMAIGLSELAVVARTVNLTPNMTISPVSDVLTTPRRRRTRAVWTCFLLLASALFVALAVFDQKAYAGTLQVRDEAHLLSAADVHRLQSVVSEMPFDARLVVTTEYPQAQDLLRLVGSLVTQPDMVVIGLDPEHRHVEDYFGSGSHIPRGARPAIESAGNEAFRHGDWAGGVTAILRAASAAVVGAPDGRSTSAPRPSLFGPVLLLMIVAGAIGIAVHFARRRAMMAGAYGSPGYGSPGYGPGPYPPGGYPPGYPMGPPQGGMGPLGGGLIGAGLGGLAGYELGKLEGEREGRDRDPGVDRGGGASAPDDDFGAGGGGSSWDDGGGGGGFDGGGGDSGGGGSDF
jgi:uncharacterized membrane protein YgcG